VLQSPTGVDRDRALACLRNVQEAGRTGLAELRSLVTVLRDDEAVDLPAPRLDGLTHLAALMSGSGLDVDLVVELPESDTVPGEQQAAIYRVVQESLTNVLRHSHADRVRVHVTGDGQCLRCIVSDPGPRREEPRPGSGHGLSGMQERLEALGGQVSAGRDGDGFRVEVVLPLPAGVS
jgi:signal transduction histidine kinase